jgi:hypothetical protein
MIDIVNGLLVLLLGVYIGEIVIKRLTDLYIEIKDKDNGRGEIHSLFLIGGKK